MQAVDTIKGIRYTIHLLQDRTVGRVMNLLFFKGTESEGISKAKQNKKPTTKNKTKPQAVIEKKCLKSRKLQEL